MILSLYLFYLSFYLLLEPTFNLRKCLLLLPVYNKKTQKHDAAEGDTLLFIDVMLMQDQASAVGSALSVLTLCGVRLLSGCLCSLQGLCEALGFQRNPSGCLDSEHVCREKLLRECPWLQLHHRQLGGGLWPSLLTQPHLSALLGQLCSHQGIQQCWGTAGESSGKGRAAAGSCLWSYLRWRNPLVHWPKLWCSHTHSEEITVMWKNQIWQPCWAIPCQCRWL